MSKSRVMLICFLIFAAIMGFDAFLYSDGVAGNSISQAIIYYSEKSKLIPFFIGFLFGGLAFHWFDNFVEPRE